MNKSPTVLEFLKELYRIWITERPTQLAAALAYYGMFSFAPVIFIAFAVAGIFIDELTMANQVFERIANTLGPELAQFIQEAVISLSQTTSSGTIFRSLISFLALLFAASGLFVNLQFALNAIWKVTLPKKGGTLAVINQRLFSFVMVIGVGLMLLLVTLISFVLSAIGSFIDISSPVPILNIIIFVGMATLAFALIYKVVPDIDIAWRDVWPGAVVTTLLVTVGGLLVGFYLGTSQGTSAFEAAGTVALLLVFFYYFAQVFLFGAVVTKVYAQMYGSKIKPAVEVDSVSSN